MRTSAEFAAALPWLQLCDDVQMPGSEHEHTLDGLPGLTTVTVSPMQKTISRNPAALSRKYRAAEMTGSAATLSRSWSHHLSQN